MRRFRSSWAAGLTLLVGLLTALTGGACAIVLDHEFDDSNASDSSVAASPPPAHGCDLLRDVAGVTSLAGSVRSLPLADGSALWIVDQGVLPDGGLVLSPVFAVSSGTRAVGTSCTPWTARFEGAAFAPSPLAQDGLLVALDLVHQGSIPALYYELFVSDSAAPLGLRGLGVGLAPQDVSSGRFVPTTELLWSSDRPSYGSSALRVGSMVYVYGCKSTGFLDGSCFVARAAPSQLASSAAYAVWAGDRWSSNPDDATSIADGATAVSVRPDPSATGGFVMTYVPPLGSTIVARRAVAPEGPWSAPETLASCGLAAAGPGSFCGGGEQHPELVAPGSTTVALTYDARTFATDAGSNADAFWPRWTTLRVP